MTVFFMSIWGNIVLALLVVIFQSVFVAKDTQLRVWNKYYFLILNKIGLCTSKALICERRNDA